MRLFCVPARSLSDTKFKIQHLPSVSLRHLPSLEEVAVKSRSSYGCLFRKHQAERQVFKRKKSAHTTNIYKVLELILQVIKSVFV